MNEITLLVLKMKESKQAVKATVKGSKLPVFNTAPHASQKIPASVSTAQAFQ
jgi:hypothetical protein